MKERAIIIAAFTMAAIVMIFVKYIVPCVGLTISIYRFKRTKNKRWVLAIGVSLLWLATSICVCVYYAYCI